MNFISPQPPRSNFPHYHFAILLAVAVSSIFFTIWATAGTLNPSAAPGSTMKTLQEIYDSIAGTSFSSSSITADQNGSLIEGLKYLNNNIFVASSSSGFYFSPTSRNVGIGTTSPAQLLQVGTGATAMAYDSTNARLGIGTTSPANSLHIKFTSGGNNPIAFMDGPSTGGSNPGIATGRGGTIKWFAGQASTITDTTGFGFFEDNAANQLRLFVATGGNVGIGANAVSPNEKLDVAGNILASTSGNVDLILRSSTAAADEGLFRLRSAGASDRLDILNQSSVLVSIASAGNVGIGTTTPIRALDVYGSAWVNGSGGDLRVVGSNTVGGAITLIAYPNSSVETAFSILATGPGATAGSGSLAIWDNLGLAYRFLISPTGNIGIGSANLSPDQLLDIKGNILASTSGNIDLILRSSTTNGVSNNDDAKFTLRVGSSSERFDIINGSGTKLVTIASAGFVGIGTATPTVKLHVLGNESGVAGVDRAIIKLEDTSGGQQWNINTYGTSSAEGAGKFGINQVGGGARFVIDTNGNVGIGTSAPTTALHVVGDSSTLFRVATGSNGRFSVQEAGLTTITNTSTSTGVGSIFRVIVNAMSQFAAMSAIMTDDSAAADEYFLAMQSDIDGTPDSEFLFTTNGNGFADGSFTGGGADVAEWIPTQDATLEAGDLVVVDGISSKSYVKKSSGIPNDSSVIGIISTDPGLVAGGGDTETHHDISKTHALVALAGRVPLKFSAENGQVQPGDHLTSSSKPGYAMKATKPGMTVGIALEASDPSKSTVTTFVRVGYWMPSGSEQVANALPLDLQGRSIVSAVLEYLEKGIITIKKIITDDIETKRIKSEAVELIGDDGSTYCVRIIGGNLQSVKGECTSQP